MNCLFEVIPPSMPNFVRFKQEVALKQYGYSIDEGFDIAKFTIDEAVEYAEFMRKTFIDHYHARVAKHSQV
jgi:hypothetical protein